MLPVEPLGLDAYEGVVPHAQTDRARRLAAEVRGMRILFVSSAPPEPSDCSRSVASLMCGLGVDAERALLYGDAAFSRVGRELADGLAGADCPLGDDRWRDAREAAEVAARRFDIRGYDAVVVHGTGAAGLIEGRSDDDAHWTWRTGRDLSRPAGHAWAHLEPLLAAYETLDVAIPGFAPTRRDSDDVRVVAGAFDPLAAARREPGPGTLAGLVADSGVDLSRPIVSQVGRLDAAIDPLAAIETWRLAREEVPGLQLAIAGRIDPSDPAAVSVLEEVRAFTAGEDDLVVATDRSGASDAQIGAIGRVSRCALPVTLTDEFDPGVSAALWQGTPVLAEGRGARAQVTDGMDGYHVTGIEERASRVIQLTSDPRRGAEMGRAGRRSAAEGFAVTRLLGDELEMLGARRAVPA